MQGGVIKILGSKDKVTTRVPRRTGICSDEI